MKSRPLPAPLPFQTPGEEIANAVLHGIGALLSVAGAVLLIIRGSGGFGGRAPDLRAVVAYSVYGAALFIMFLASTLYHAIQAEGGKRVLRIFDHSAIYLLIAGTYTPFCLVGLRGAWGWSLFGVEWGLAVLGVVLYSVGSRALKKIEVAVYILMGWAVVAGWKPLIAALNPAAVVWLAIGGVCYTLGTVWYGRKVRRGAHVVWHVFVLLGAAAHFMGVWAIG
jgi:hemolysin III